MRTSFPLVVITAALLSLPVEAASYRVVVHNQTAVPDGTGNFELAGGLALSSSGAAVFAAYDAGDFSWALWRWDDGALVRVANEADLPVENSSVSVVNLIDTVSIDGADGILVGKFDGGVYGGPGSLSHLVSVPSCWTENDYTNQPYQQGHMLLPGGYVGLLADCDSGFLWGGNGSVSPVVDVDEVVDGFVGATGTVVVKGLVEFTASAGAIYFVASLGCETGVDCLDGHDNRALLKAGDGQLTLLYQSQYPTDVPAASPTVIGLLSSSASGRVGFGTELHDDPGVGGSRTAFVLLESGTPRILAEEGGPAPGGSGTLLVKQQAQLLFNVGDELVTFYAVVDEGGAEKECLFQESASGLAPLVCAGDAVPGDTEGWVIDRFTDFRFAPSGRVAFEGVIRMPGPSTEYAALFAQRQSGELVVVARQLHSFTADGLEDTFTHDLALGGKRAPVATELGFNDAGHVLVIHGAPAVAYLRADIEAVDEPVDLSVALAAEQVGARFEYTATVTNAGPGIAAGLDVVFTPPAGSRAELSELPFECTPTTDRDGALTSVACSYPTATLLAGATATYAISVLLPGPGPHTGSVTVEPTLANEADTTNNAAAVEATALGDVAGAIGFTSDPVISAVDAVLEVTLTPDGEGLTGYDVTGVFSPPVDRAVDPTALSEGCTFEEESGVQVRFRCVQPESTLVRDGAVLQLPVQPPHDDEDYALSVALSGTVSTAEGFLVDVALESETPVSVEALADLEVWLTRPEVEEGGVFCVGYRNRGPARAEDVELTVSVEGRVGTLDHTGCRKEREHLLRCDLGSLAADATDCLALRGETDATTGSIEITSSTTDPNEGNNRASFDQVATGSKCACVAVPSRGPWLGLGLLLLLAVPLGTRRRVRR